MCSFTSLVPFHFSVSEHTRAAVQQPFWTRVPYLRYLPATALPHTLPAGRGAVPWRYVVGLLGCLVGLSCRCAGRARHSASSARLPSRQTGPGVAPYGLQFSSTHRSARSAASGTRLACVSSVVHCSCVLSTRQGHVELDTVESKPLSRRTSEAPPPAPLHRPNQCPAHDKKV